MVDSTEPSVVIVIGSVVVAVDCSVIFVVIDSSVVDWFRSIVVVGELVSDVVD